MSRIDTAVARFEEGCSCVQAIFSTYAESLGMDRQTAMKLSSGFGGGMGRMALTCGAVTGAFSESFEDADLAERRWYDGTSFRIVGETAAGKGCIEYEWPDR